MTLFAEPGLKFTVPPDVLEAVRAMAIGESVRTLQGLMEAASAEVKDRALAPLEDRMARLLRGHLRRQVKAFAAAVAKLPIEAKLQEAGPITTDELDRIWRETTAFTKELILDEMGNVIGQATQLGSNKLVAELGWNLSFALINTAAIREAMNYAADTVDRIDELTRVRVRNLVTKGVMEGKGADQLAADLRKLGKSWTTPARQKHIKDRAHLIAVNELALAFERGGLQTARMLGFQGIRLQKRWLALRDNRVDELCLNAMAKQWVPVEADYLPGIKTPPMHPACRCAVTYRWPEQQEEEAKLEGWRPTKATTRNWRDFLNMPHVPAAGRGDSILRRIASHQGFTDKPRILSGGQFLAAEQAGWTRFWRGMDGGRTEAQRYATAAKSGDYYAGRGIWGSGIYAASGKAVYEQAYGFNTPGYKRAIRPTESEAVARGFAGSDGKVLTGFLDPKARIISYSDLEAKWLKAIKEWSEGKPPVAASGAARERGPKGEELLTYPPTVYGVEDLPPVLQDPGRFAAALGYDAIFIPKSDRISQSRLGDQYVILNRSILHIVEL